MTDQQQQEREAFEAWYRANWSDRFGTAICDASWAIWRAAWQARASLAVQPAVVPAGGVPLLVGVDRAEGVDTTVTAYKCQGCGCINVVSESVVPARPVGDTELAALLKRADETITQLEYHRETHRQWAECDLSHNAANPQIGDNAWHAEVVKDYDRMLATVRDLRLRAATAAGEPDTRLGPDISPGIRYKCVLSLLRAYGMTTANAEKCLDDEDFVSWLKDTAPPEQGWRPIESAPRDGTKILVAVRGESTMVRWHEPAWLGAGGRCYQFDDPTHWMPPPPPPQQPDPEKQKQGREREVAESGVGRGQHGGGGES